MGCDIHMRVELEDYVYDSTLGTEKKAWTLVVDEPAAYGDRNYALFGILAGVRAPDMPLLAEPRGVPPDASEGVAVAAKGTDWHSHSWTTLKEILDFDWSQKTPYNDAPTCADACSDFLDWIKFLREGPTRLKWASRRPEQIRFVFWFDN